MHHPVEVVMYKIYSIEEAAVDRYQVNEVDHRSHHQSALPIKVVEEVVNHQIGEVEVVVEVEHVVIASHVNDDEMMRITIQII